MLQRSQRLGSVRIIVDTGDAACRRFVDADIEHAAISKVWNRQVHGADQRGLVVERQA